MRELSALRMNERRKSSRKRMEMSPAKRFLLLLKIEIKREGETDSKEEVS